MVNPEPSVMLKFGNMDGNVLHKSKDDESNNEQTLPLTEKRWASFATVDVATLMECVVYCQRAMSACQYWRLHLFAVLVAMLS